MFPLPSVALPLPRVPTAFGGYTTASALCFHCLRQPKHCLCLVFPLQDWIEALEPDWRALDQWRAVRAAVAGRTVAGLHEVLGPRRHPVPVSGEMGKTSMEQMARATPLSLLSLSLSLMLLSLLSMLLLLLLLLLLSLSLLLPLSLPSRSKHSAQALDTPGGAKAALQMPGKPARAGLRAALRREVEVAAAVGETVILLHPPQPLVGISIGMKRVSSNDRTLADA